MHHLLATLGVLLAALAIAAAVRAALGAIGGGYGPRSTTTGSGAIAITDSREGEAILWLNEVARGASGEGEVMGC